MLTVPCTYVIAKGLGLLHGQPVGVCLGQLVGCSHMQQVMEQSEVFPIPKVMLPWEGSLQQPQNQDSRGPLWPEEPSGIPC